MSNYLPVLPDEVVAETILWRLPVKSIMQCKCVCKSWYSLIKNPNFISNHFIRSKTLNPKNPQKILAQWHKHDEIENCLLHFDKDDYFRSMSLHFPYITFDLLTQIVGSVNGLICFSIGHDSVNHIVNFVLFNPSIGKFQSIHPPSVRLWKVKGFGFDERTQDYKILLIMPDDAYFMYSLNLNVWREIMIITPDNWSFRAFNSVVFVNGRFHWLAAPSIYDTLFIRVFDVKTETFGQISLPECLSNYSEFRFTDFGECSVAVIEQAVNPRGCKNGFENHIWVMKEYGSVESWVKLATIRLASFCEHVLGFRNENEVFIRRESRGSKSKSGCIALQKINKQRGQVIKELMHFDNILPLNFCVHTYVPSLFLLDKPNNVEVAAPTYTTVDIAVPTRFRKSVAHGSPNCRKKPKL